MSGDVPLYIDRQLHQLWPDSKRYLPKFRRTLLEEVRRPRLEAVTKCSRDKERKQSKLCVSWRVDTSYAVVDLPPGVPWSGKHGWWTERLLFYRRHLREAVTAATLAIDVSSVP
ncbi:hypothetical protein GQ600_18684 [Phytophthora cactorum]|nr:hypothetical protein GQ600_18684 [Phytophthora cactorum]